MGIRDVARMCAGCGLHVDDCRCGDPAHMPAFDEVDDRGEPDPPPPGDRERPRPKTMPWRANPTFRDWHRARRIERMLDNE